MITIARMDEVSAMRTVGSILADIATVHATSMVTVLWWLMQYRVGV